ncbi:hypothetical protein HYY74_05550 [Candidatus Woesearchaeota archaeon]|nr:hypothetical protein [Candidatus Woesearchaeota archaeon]
MGTGSNRVWLAVVVGFLMVTSVIGLAFVNYGGSGDSLSYGKYSFKRQQDGSLVAKINGREVSFTFFPAEVEELPLDRSILQRLNSTRMIYTTSDYGSIHSQVIALVQFDLGLAMNDHFGIYVVRGFTENLTRLPVITCGNATAHIPVVLFQEGNSTGFREEGDCIVAEAGSFDEFVRLRDRLLYGLLGVVNG